MAKQDDTLHVARALDRMFLAKQKLDFAGAELVDARSHLPDEGCSTALNDILDAATHLGEADAHMESTGDAAFGKLDTKHQTLTRKLRATRDEYRKTCQFGRKR